MKLLHDSRQVEDLAEAQHGVFSAAELRAAAAELTEESISQELGGLLPGEELTGVALRMRAAITKLAERLEGASEA